MAPCMNSVLFLSILLVFVPASGADVGVKGLGIGLPRCVSTHRNIYVLIMSLAHGCIN